VRNFCLKFERASAPHNDLDDGRLICLVGFASVKPAEFVIFHITQNGERELTNPFAAQQDEWVLAMHQRQLCSAEATPSEIVE